jgi:ABC-type cobalamin/Fe3+-siderophores transport system ATPase subunit
VGIVDLAERPLNALSGGQKQRALNEVAHYVERIALVVERGFRIGTVAQIMTEETLTQMYGIAVDVDEMHGHRIVVARRPARNSGGQRHALGAVRSAVRPATPAQQCWRCLRGPCA